MSFFCGAAGAQSSTVDSTQTGATGSAQTYTLRASARSVITDVLVLDHAGRPVHGLPQSAFHLSDEKQAQNSYLV
ncbi:hypothetical protein [Terriglobus aquaticus]|uniref:Uncharacterized protein n=1 Tax=Terriglobus aquaticus TaxID=940139 RepID=A0ABW9KH86_9BACT